MSDEPSSYSAEIVPGVLMRIDGDIAESMSAQEWLDAAAQAVRKHMEPRKHMDPILQDVEWKKASDDSIRPKRPLFDMMPGLDAMVESERQHAALTSTITWVPVGERLPGHRNPVLAASIGCGFQPVLVRSATLAGGMRVWESLERDGERLLDMALWPYWAALPEGPA